MDFLLFLGGIDRANAATGAAIDTGLFVNDKNAVAGGNTIHRAFGFTRTAIDALVVDHISHYQAPPFKIQCLFYHICKADMVEPALWRVARHGNYNLRARARVTGICAW